MALLQPVQLFLAPSDDIVASAGFPDPSRVHFIITKRNDSGGYEYRPQLYFKLWIFACGLSQIQPPEPIYPQFMANRQSQVGQAAVNHHVLTRLYPLLLWTPVTSS